MSEILRAQRGLASVRANAKYNKKGGKEEMRMGMGGRGWRIGKERQLDFPLPFPKPLTPHPPF
jgi:hypothetical protein